MHQLVSTVAVACSVLLVSLTATIAKNATIPANPDFPYLSYSWTLFGFLEDTSSFHVRYNSDRSGNSIKITPDVPYLHYLDHQSTIRGVHVFYNPFNWEVPKVSIKISNSTNRTLLFDEARFRIVDSAIDTRPIPWFRSLNNPNALYIENDGWGPLLNASVDLGIIPDRECEKNTSRTTDLKHFEIGSIEYGHELKIPHQMILSVPMKQIEENHIVCAVGFLNYDDVPRAPRRIPFATAISLFPPRSEAPAPPTASYDLRLRAGKSGYTHSLPIQQALKAGEFDNFLVAIWADKSADFRMAVDLHATDGTVVSLGDVELFFFRPRSIIEPRLDRSRYTMTDHSYYAAPELSVYVSKVTQNPDNPESFFVYVTEHWVIASETKRDELKAILSDGLRKLGLKHGGACYIYPSGQCEESGPFHWR